MKVMVTGGAGFIGSAVCRLLVGELNTTVLNVDKLTYAANLESLRAIEANPRYVFRRSGCRSPPSGGISCGPFDRRSRRIYQDQRRGHLRPSGGRARTLAEPSSGAGGTFSFSPCVDGRGFRLARGHRQIQRGHTLSAELALLGIEGGLRSPGPRVAGNLWAAHLDQQLLEQLRTLPFSREADPTCYSEGAARQAGPGLWERCEYSRLAIRRGSRSGPVPDLERRPGGRKLQCRRQRRADQSRCCRVNLPLA